ncbi:MAG: type II toxin-antitoxin system RelE/ParE family toxin [Gemmatimonadales bacterium]
MTPIRWSEEAFADLEAIHAYIARDSDHYASRTVERILQAVDRLEMFPELGRIVPEFQRSDIRELIVGAYRIVYHVDVASVGLITIIHGARLLRLLPDAV